LQVINLTARPEVLARRLAVRGHEVTGSIAERLRAAGTTLPDLPGTSVHHIDNSGPLDHAVQAVIAFLPPPTSKEPSLP